MKKFHTNKSSKKTNHSQSILRLEALEKRQMLSVSPASASDLQDETAIFGTPTDETDFTDSVTFSLLESVASEESNVSNKLLSTSALSSSDYSAIYTEYADLNLPETQSELNIIEIANTDLSLENLKSAIATAKTTVEDDLIIVRTTADNNTITYTAQTDEIIIDVDSQHGSVTIVSINADGTFTNDLTIDANGVCRVMTVQGNSNATFPEVNLGGLTITGGRINGSTMNLTRGGGIYNNYGNLTLTNSTINGNTISNSGDGDGGGIFNNGTLVVTNSTISENSVSDDGGGLCNSGTMTIIDCTISENTASKNGGGIENKSHVELTIINSTLYGNSTGLNGGGIFNYINGILTVTNCTIVGNRNGGISNSSGFLTLDNSIVSMNNGRNISGNSTGNNNITDDQDLFVVNPVLDSNGNLTNADTLDLHLHSESAAIDAGNSELAPEGRLISGEAVDIGAYEYEYDSGMIKLLKPTFNTLTAFGMDASNMTLSASWDEVENATSYTLEYRLAGTTDWTVISDLTETTATFTANAKSTYEIRIKAVGEGDYIDSGYHEQSYEVPVSHCQEEYTKLRNFLETIDADGIKNGLKITGEYNADDLFTWEGVYWQEIDGVNRVVNIEWGGRNLTGRLDLSNFTGLERLICGDNQLTSINLSNNNNLREIHCHNNLLAGHWHILNCPQLELLRLDNNRLELLRIADSPRLRDLLCNHNALTQLDVRNCPMLRALECSLNRLNTLDVSQNSELEHLVCYSNQLTSLNLSKNLNLNELWCYSTNLQQVTLPETSINKTQIYMFEGSSSAWTFTNSAGKTIGNTDANEGAFYMLPSSPVTATSTAGKSVDFNTVALLTLSTPTLETLEMSTITGTSVSVKWSEVENATSYTLKYRKTGETDWKTIPNIFQTTTTFTGDAKATYEICVKAVGNMDYWDSEYSDAQSITIPVPYNNNDFTRLQKFLEQTDENGVKNGTKINSAYNADDPTTWRYISWTEIDNVKRLSYISWTGLNLVGNLDLSGCNELKTLQCYNNQLTALNVTGNVALTLLN
ncbi:MAG: choice-of-anchor Q domain-containing protein, partial [Planctomycetia bacterium]|nr:choice-of-anchor Q domain-containing protein [Planctomycetia bacterium]